MRKSKQYLINMEPLMVLKLFGAILKIINFILDVSNWIRKKRAMKKASTD